MLHPLSIGLLVVAFFGAGLVNAIGIPAAKGNFVRWGYPGWWCHATGLLEIAAAAMIAVPAARAAGLLLGAAIITGAALTVLRHRDLSHLIPLGIFVALLAAARFVP